MQVNPAPESTDSDSKTLRKLRGRIMREECLFGAGSGVDGESFMKFR